MLYVCCGISIACSIFLWALLFFASVQDIKTYTYSNKLALVVLLVCFILGCVFSWLDYELSIRLSTGTYSSKLTYLFLLAMKCFCLPSHIASVGNVGIDIVLRVLIAFVTAAVLLVSEGLYRLFFKRMGLGMGDVKCVSSVALVYPGALLVFCAGCLLLFVVGLIVRKRTLPALPFFTCSLFVFMVVCVMTV